MKQHNERQLSLWLDEALDLFLRLPNASTARSVELPAPAAELAHAFEFLSKPSPDWTRFYRAFERWEARHWAFVSGIAPEQARLSPRLRTLLGAS